MNVCSFLMNVRSFLMNVCSFLMNVRSFLMNVRSFLTNDLTFSIIVSTFSMNVLIFPPPLSPSKGVNSVSLLRSAKREAIRRTDRLLRFARNDESNSAVNNQFNQLNNYFLKSAISLGYSLLSSFFLISLKIFIVYSTSSSECAAVGISRSITVSLGTTG